MKEQLLEILNQYPIRKRHEAFIRTYWTIGNHYFSTDNHNNKAWYHGCWNEELQQHEGELVKPISRAGLARIHRRLGMEHLLGQLDPIQPE